MNRKSDILLRAASLFNLGFMALTIYLCYSLYYGRFVTSKFFAHADITLTVIFALLYFRFAKLYEAFDVKLTRISELAYSQCLSAVFSDTVMYVILALLMRRLPNIVPALIAVAVQVVFALCWCYCTHKLYFKFVPAQKTAIVYDTNRDLKGLIKSYGMNKKFEVAKDINIRECLENLSVLDGYSTVFLRDISSHARNIIIKYCVAKNINVFVVPRVGDMIMYGAKHRHMFHLPIMKVERYSPGISYLVLKRAADVVLSLAAIIILSPLMLVTALAVKLCDRGPAFYKQDRLTKDGKIFKVIKFRSMRVDAEKDGARLSSGENDDRITPVGRIIRKVRLDELPQLFNILGGSMSFVGPRPERPEIAQEYYKTLPEFELRLQTKAGLTGYAQIYGKYNTTPYDKLRMDLVYIAQPSIITDIALMFATVKILFLPESTEGIAEGQTTAMGTVIEDEEDLI